MRRILALVCTTFVLLAPALGASPRIEQARAQRVHCRRAGKVHLAQMICRLPGHRSWGDYHQA